MEFDNRREYLRIRDAVQVRFRLLTAAEAGVETKARHERPSVHNLALIKALEEAVLKTKEEGGLSILLLHKIIEIDDKLARILSSLDRQPSVQGPDRSARTINLSAGGCSLPPAPDLVPGVLVDLTLELPTFPPIAIRAVGSVVRSPAEAGEPSVAGISFDAIHEEDREMLYHYIFQRQREQIRESSRGHGVSGQSTPHQAK